MKLSVRKYFIRFLAGIATCCMVVTVPGYGMSNNQQEHGFFASIVSKTFSKMMALPVRKALAQLTAFIFGAQTRNIPMLKEAKQSNLGCLESDTNVLMASCQEFGLQQIPVFDQSAGNAHESGGASCGYHALKNGIMLAQGQFEALTDKNMVNDLFSMLTSNHSMGFWRREMVNRRLERVFFEHIKNQLSDQFIKNNSVNHPQETAIRTTLKSIINDLARETTKKILESSGQYVTVTPDSIVRKINTLDTTLTPTDDAYSLNQRQARVLLKQDSGRTLVSQFIAMDAAGKTFSEQNAQEALELYNQRASLHGSNRVAISGEWLDAGELECLVKLERKQGILLADQQVEFSIIDDIDLIDDPNISPCNFEEIAQKLSSNPNYKHIFILGTMAHNHQTGFGAAGHWFTLGVTPGGAFVSDSLGNMDRLSDRRVEAVIRKLGKDAWLTPQQGYAKLIAQDIEKTLADLESSIKKNDEKQTAQLQLTLMKLQEKYRVMGGTINYQDRIHKIIEIGFEAARKLDHKREQLHGEISDLFYTEKNIEKLQMALITKQYECEQLGLSFKPYEKHFEQIWKNKHIGN